MSTNQINELANSVITKLNQSNKTVATAESCTGGLIAAALTDIAGASSVFGYGFVTYANQAKIELLDVQPQTLEAYGAVSWQTAEQMCEGALTNAKADIALSVTGIAGPGGGSAEKPVGLVYFGLSQTNALPQTFKHMFTLETRHSIRLAAVKTGLKLLSRALDM